MKKKLALVLTMVLVFSNSMVVFGASPVTSAGGSDGHDVKATYVTSASGTAVYSVDISWGDLNFTYTNNGKWDATHHNYGTSGSWSPDAKDPSKNTITVTNNSNVKVKPTFSIADNNLLPEGVTLNIKKDNDTIIADATKDTQGKTDLGEEVQTASDGSSTGTALQREVFVTLNGNPTTTFQPGKIASVTVTINAVP